MHNSNLPAFIRRLTAGGLALIFALGMAALPLQAKKPAPQAGANAPSTNFSFDTNEYSYTTPGSKRSTGSVILTLIQSLLVIAVIAAGLYYFLRFIAKKQNQGNVNAEAIKVISQNAVAVGRYLTIVKVLNTYYVLGLAESGVSLIREITDRSEIDKLKEMETEILKTGAAKVGFQDYLKDIISRFKKSGKPPVEKVTPDRILGFLKNQNERLNKMNTQNGKNGKNDGGKP